MCSRANARPALAGSGCDRALPDDQLRQRAADSVQAFGEHFRVHAHARCENDRAFRRSDPELLTCQIPIRKRSRKAVSVSVE